MKQVLSFCLLGCVLFAGPQAKSSETPGDILYIKQIWPVGGTGDSLSHMVLDPSQLQLFLAYRKKVIVEDVKTGTVIGEIPNTNGAFGIALDNTNEYGYISDGRYNLIDVFDRRTLQVVGRIPAVQNPTMVLFEPISNLVFTIGSVPKLEKPGTPPAPYKPALMRSEDSSTQRSKAFAANDRGKKPEELSLLTVIDAESWRNLSSISLPGKVEFAGTAGNGHIYLGLPSRGRILRVDAEALGRKLRSALSDSYVNRARTPKEEQLNRGMLEAPEILWNWYPLPALDWNGDSNLSQEWDNDVISVSIGRGCDAPHALAVDERHIRLFLACSNSTVKVLDAATGDAIALLRAGLDISAIAYDPNHSLIYALNNGRDGTLTVIRQYVTDSYQVTQTLPTKHWAKSLSADPTSGLVYLVTLATDAKTMNEAVRPWNPEEHGYQVLVIGN